MASLSLTLPEMNCRSTSEHYSWHYFCTFDNYIFFPQKMLILWHSFNTRRYELVERVILQLHQPEQSFRGLNRTLFKGTKLCKIAPSHPSALCESFSTASKWSPQMVHINLKVIWISQISVKHLCCNSLTERISMQLHTVIKLKATSFSLHWQTHLFKTLASTDPGGAGSHYQSK